MLFLLVDSPQKLQLKNIHDTLIILFYVRPRSPQLQRLLFFYWKHKKQVQLQWTRGIYIQGLYIQTNLRNKFLKKLYKIKNVDHHTNIK